MPTGLILGFLGLGIASFFSTQALSGFLLYNAIYFFSLSLESLRITYRNDIKLWPGVIASLFFIHAGYGIGFGRSFIDQLLNVRTKGFESLSR
jgi:hypothetical protein